MNSKDSDTSIHVAISNNIQIQRYFRFLVGDLKDESMEADRKQRTPKSAPAISRVAFTVGGVESLSLVFDSE